MISTLRADRAPLGQYFSFDRYEEGSGVDLSGADTRVLQEVFVERSADPTVWQPFIEATNSLWPERWSIGVSSVDATYEQPGTPGADTDARPLRRRRPRSASQQALSDPPPGADVDGDVPGLATEVSVEHDGGFTVLSFEGLVPPGLGMDDRTSLVVSEDRMVALPREVTMSGALVQDREESQLRSEAVRQVAGALVPLMNLAAGCIDPPEMKVQGSVVIDSCRSDGAKWASTVRDGFDASSPFRFE